MVELSSHRAGCRSSVLVDNYVDNTGLTYHNWVSSDRRYSVFVRATF